MVGVRILRSHRGVPEVFFLSPESSTVFFGSNNPLKRKGQSSGNTHREGRKERNRFVLINEKG